nr:M64 family metallo-endopeptidase [Bacteroidales bacterium]
AQRFIDFMFLFEPYTSNKEKFNIWLVKSESEESGTDIPGHDIFKNTVLNSNFYTFGSERYLTTADFTSVRDAASVVPYDDICILVNSEKYGGGGIYNHYCISTVDHALSNEVFIHELGHSFGGLGDEYYNSSTAYSDFFNLEIEPWQPNLTTLVNFDLKWKLKMNSETPIPTPREDQFKNTVGVYEGGGYVSKGMYSPYIDCRMKTNEAEGFCPVCQDAMAKMISFKSE